MRKFSFILLGLLLSTYLFSQETENLESKFLKNTRQLIYEGNRSGEGYFSDDGRYMIFQSEREADNPFYQIYILDFETGDINRVSPGHGKTTCAFFQWNGDRIMYSSSHLDPDARKKQQEELDFRESGEKRRYSWDYETTMDIFSANRDGSDIKQLTEAEGYDAEGSYSPDGKLIVYSTNKDVYNRKLSKEEKQKLEVDASYFCDLYIMTADGSGKRQLTDTPGYDGGPFFSPDGKRVIFRRFSEDGHAADVYTINIDGTEEKRLTDFGCLSWAPYYHPSGDYIVWAANKLGYSNFEIYMTDVEGLKEPVRVSFKEGFDGLPVFSPDGKKMVWTSSRTGNGKAQLFIANWDDAYAREQLASAPYRKNAQGSLNIIFTPTISEPELQEKLTYIASDELEGRMTGSQGIQLAADYISAIFENQGLDPLADNKDYNFPFDFVAEVKINEKDNSLKIADKDYTLFKDFKPLPSTESGSAEANIVFAGYGIKVNDGKDYEYDSYSSLDVTDKIVMVLSGIPDELDEEKEKLFERNIASGYKQMIARQNGAKAVLLVSSRVEKSKNHEVVGTSGIISVAITEDLANKILSGNNETIEGLKDKLKDGDAKGLEHLFETEVKASLKTNVERVISQDNNIVAMVPSENPEADYIFIGAHYDHLGFGETNSRAMGENKKQVHNGADDNGSGTVAVIELAEYFAGLKKENPEAITHNLVFCLWSGEELGLLGSNSFALNLPVPAEKVKAYLNFDMVGRVQNNKLEIQGLGSAEEWKSIIEKKNIVAGFNLALSNDPYLPTDATSFYLKGIPTISFFSGIHSDYHTDKDDVELINFEDMHRVVKFSSLIMKELMKPEQALTYQQVKVKFRKSSKGALSVSLGTIPAYAGSDEPGVAIQGVRPGGPAEKAKLLAGDIIIGLNGKETNNIYDFMNILNELKPDVEIEIIVKRNGEDVKLKIVPEAKK
ncbi:MAG: M28 family peptidase [Bacteroidales bacterium]|jgi:Tol biopolymer transport system component|nr:M28 family peptidase [Bacteroidales bacterium]